MLPVNSSPLHHLIRRDFVKSAAAGAAFAALPGILKAQQPNAPIEDGYRHAVALIMSNASLRTGMKATFDKDARQVMAGGKVFKGY